MIGRITPICLLLFLPVAAVGQDAPLSSRAISPLATIGPKPNPVGNHREKEVEAAITRGCEFLLERQNDDGSWGSARLTKGLNIYAPAPGSHLAFRAAVTSLSVSALLESGHKDERTLAAVDRGEVWLLKHLHEVRRPTPMVLYNNWAHFYGIQALVRLHEYRHGMEKRQEKIRELIALQVYMLERYECIDGGWGYLDFEVKSQKTAASSMAFMTGAVLVALDEARRIGVEVPKRLSDRAIASIERQRKPDFSYAYGEYLKMSPMRGINRPAGSLGRSQVCNLALRLWGDKRVTDEVMVTWIDRLVARNFWFDIARKRPVPHESLFQVSGYFFYYGYYYAAMCIDELPADQRPRLQNHLVHVLLPLQEKDGSWWDYPLYDYHQQYGTAFAVMALVRCRKK